MLKEVQDMEVEASVFDRVGRRGRSNSRNSFDDDDDNDDDDDDDDDDNYDGGVDDEAVEGRYSNDSDRDGFRCKVRQRSGDVEYEAEEESGESAASSDNSNERYEQEERPAKKMTRSELYKAKFRECTQ